MRIYDGFFRFSAEKVAKNLIGKIIVRKYKGRVLKAKIIETEAYLGKDDPSSWARFGKRKDNAVMWERGGKILIKNVHKHLMLNFSTGKKGDPQAVLIRAAQPLNFLGRCSGPGLLTKTLFIKKDFNGKSICELKNFYLLDSSKKYKIKKSFRIGVKNDLKRKLRFYVDKGEYTHNKN